MSEVVVVVIIVVVVVVVVVDAAAEMEPEKANEDGRVRTGERK